MKKYYYLIILFFLICIITSLIIINNSKKIENNNLENNETIEILEEKNKNNNFKSFLLSTIILISFFGGCYFSALIVENHKNLLDKYCGIIYLLVIGVILLITNFTVFDKEKIREYISGKKFSKIGVIMFIGIGAIIFGFIDNFGMRLGTEALDDVFVEAFLAPLSQHTKFYKYTDNIQDNFKIINKWTEHDWRKVMNHVLRFKDEISKNKKMQDLTNVIKSFQCDPLVIPKTILKNKETNEYVDNLRSKYDIIHGSKGMLGNTFSNFCAGLLGAGIIGLFTYLTAYDDVDIGDNKLQKDYSDIVEKFSPVLEAVFITIGCLIPIFLNIAMKNSTTDNNNFNSWLIIYIVLFIIIIMMYFSYKKISIMTTENKKNGIINTLNILKKRYNINENNEKILINEVDEFINKINKK